MAGFIDNLRQKPERTRKQIAAGTSAVVTGLIFVMWLTVLNYGQTEPIQSEAVAEGAGNTQQVASPLSAFGANAQSAFSDISDAWSALGDGEQNDASEAVGPEAEKSSAVNLGSRSGGADEAAQMNQSQSQTETAPNNDGFFSGGSSENQPSTEAGNANAEAQSQTSAQISGGSADEANNEPQADALPNRSGADREAGEETSAYWADADFSRSAQTEAKAIDQAASVGASGQTSSNVQSSPDDEGESGPAFNSLDYNSNQGDGFF